MIAVDSNVLLRKVLDDDVKQPAKVRSIAAERRNGS